MPSGWQEVINNDGNYIIQLGSSKIHFKNGQNILVDLIQLRQHNFLLSKVNKNYWMHFLNVVPHITIDLRYKTEANGAKLKLYRNGRCVAITEHPLEK